MSLSNPLRGILDVKRLTGPNYTDWLRNLRIVLTVEKIMYVLDTMMPTPEEGASENEIARYMKYIVLGSRALRGRGELVQRKSFSN